MEQLVDNALRPHPGGEVLSEAFRLQITRKDIATLAGLNWLNDEASENSYLAWRVKSPFIVLLQFRNDVIMCVVFGRS